MTGDHGASGHANARLELQIRKLFAQLAGSGKRVPGHVLQGQGRAEYGQGGIAFELVDDALVAVYALHHAVEEFVQGLDHVFRIALGSKPGGADHVHEQHRHVAGFPAQFRLLLQRSAGHIRAHETPEQFRNPLAFPQATHHLVETSLQHTNLGGIVDAHRGVSFPASHPVDGILQLPDGIHHRHREQARSCIPGQQHRDG